MCITLSETFFFLRKHQCLVFDHIPKVLRLPFPADPFCVGQKSPSIDHNNGGWIDGCTTK